MVTERARDARRRRQHRRLGLRGLEQHALDPSGPGRQRCCRRGTSRRRSRRPAPKPHHRAGGRRRPQRRCRSTRSRTRACVWHFVPEMPLRVSALRGARRLHQRVRDRELHGRAGAGRRRRPGRVPAAPSRGSARPRRRAAARPSASAGQAGQLPHGPRARLRLRPLQELAAYLRRRGRGRGGARDRAHARACAPSRPIDSGEVVNPDGIRNQIEGGILQSIELDALRERSPSTTRGSPASTGRAIRSCASTPCRTASRCTSSTGPGEPFLGTGEAAQGPTAAAIANAIADATGQRLRDLPFTRETVKAAIGV